MRINIYLTLARVISLALVAIFFLCFCSMYLDSCNFNVSQSICPKIKLNHLISQQDKITSIETTSVDEQTSIFILGEGCFNIDLGIREVRRKLGKVNWYDGKSFYLNKSQIISCGRDEENCKYGWRLVTMSDDSTYCINKNNYKKIEACR